LAILTVLAAAVALSVGIEFTQIYFPPRTVSQNDLLAETIGALVGVALWCALGPRLMAWVDDWARGRGTPGAGERLLYVYLAGLFAYNLLPLDLTVSPVEVFHKFREGRLVVIPFGGLPPQPMQALYDLATDVLIWVPVGLLWRVGGRAPGRALRDGLLFGLLIEFLQLWVFSRVSDVTDVFTAGFGAWLGALAGGRLWRETQAVRDTGGSIDAAAVFSLLGILAWTGALAAIFWYPFDFNTDGQFLRERVGALRSVPFTAYYYGTEFRAATEVLHKVLFFAPLGMLLGCALSALRWRHAWAWVFGVTIAAGVAGVIEAVQLALPGKNADITDWVLECAGAIGGFWIARAVLRSHFPPRRTASRRPAPGSTRREGAPRA